MKFSQTTVLQSFLFIFVLLRCAKSCDGRQSPRLPERFRLLRKHFRAGEIDHTESSDETSGVKSDFKHEKEHESPVTGSEKTLVLKATSHTTVSVSELPQKYGGKVMHVQSPLYPHCDIYLCGTLHVADASIGMVRDVVRSVMPNYVILELCGERLETLHPIQEAPEIDTILKVVKLSWKQRSLKTFFSELFALMQNRGAQLLGGRVGGELNAAARAGHEVGSTVILGDRAYSVTMQRIQDRLTFRGKIVVAFMLLWETVTMSVIKMKDFARSTENDLDFVQAETDHFAKHLPVLAEVVIFERDTYMARTIADVASLGFGALPPPGTVPSRRGRIVAVVGAGHLAGIKRQLMSGHVSSAQVHAFANSSAHNSTWAGPGMLHVVDVTKLYAGL